MVIGGCLTATLLLDRLSRLFLSLADGFGIVCRHFSALFVVESGRPPHHVAVLAHMPVQRLLDRSAVFHIPLGGPLGG